MTAPSLLMSTSSSGSQEMARNLAPPPRHDTASKATGRGRRATRPPAQKRPPQRGLGVAQLERLRLRDHWKNMTQMPLPQLRGELQIQTQLLGPPLDGAPLRYSPADYCKASQPSVTYPCQMLGGERGVAVQTRGSFTPYGSDRAVGNLCMAGVRGSAAALEVPRELSSMPNVRCLPDHCAVSVQKNSINSARNTVVFDNGAHISNRAMPVMNGHDFLALNLGSSFSSGGNFTSGDESHVLHSTQQAIHQDLEAMGAGRKVKAVGGDSLLMEYEFFPGKCNSSGSTFLEKLCFPAEEYEAETSASGFAVKNRSGGGESSCRKDPNSIDLSLRLSY